eukprot:scaffold374_cov124-Cylindrotheca_fusiformis.AAC.4
MNISLASKKKKAKKATIGYGLNNRSGASKTNVFGESSSSEDEQDDNGGTSNRRRVNQQILKEQDALRKRAQAAAASLEENSVYDYDGAYDSFKAPENTNPSPKKEERSSKYIGDLLKAAKQRERERDLIYERKLAKEQAEEDGQSDYQGKEKFITNAYKRKLEERKQWEQEEKEKERQEDENDVTKKTAGTAFANFYGNLNRNVAMGGEKAGTAEDGYGSVERDNTEEAPSRDGPGFLSGFERTDGASEQGKDEDNEAEPPSEPKEENEVSAPVLCLREKREEKVREARKRYLQRKKMMIPQ